jgi:hypothetical protein
MIWSETEWYLDGELELTEAKNDRIWLTQYPE